jgi:hypothetical protein
METPKIAPREWHRRSQGIRGGIAAATSRVPERHQRYTKRALLINHLVEDEVPGGLFPFERRDAVECELGGVCEAVNDDGAESRAEELQHGVAADVPGPARHQHHLPACPRRLHCRHSSHLSSLYSPSERGSAKGRGDDRTEEKGEAGESVIGGNLNAARGCRTPVDRSASRGRRGPLLHQSGVATRVGGLVVSGFKILI